MSGLTVLSMRSEKFYTLTFMGGDFGKTQSAF